MYLNKIPQNNEIVFVQLLSNSDNYVKLVDYELNGLILCTEITKYKDNLKNIVRLNEIFPVMVLHLKNEYIDLSYNKVKQDKRELLKSCYNYQTKLFNFISKMNIDKETLDKIMSEYLSPDNYVESVLTDRNISKEKYESFILNPINDDIKKYIESKILIKPYECELDFKLSIFDNSSLSQLKDILVQIKNFCDLTCKSSPVYQIRVKHLELNNISAEFEEIKNKITKITDNYNCNLEFNSDFNIIKRIEIQLK
jgi:translation initiation factor 2 alpha subunit (eIF-2alpha)